MTASAVLLVMLGGQPALDVPPREREVLLELFALSAWEAQQLFLALGADVSWTVERRQPRCDFE